MKIWSQGVVLAIASALWVLQPTPACALDKAKVAANMAKQATAEYTEGRYARCAELLRGAQEVDPQPAYLWSLARCEHLAGQHDRALGHYREFISNPGTLGDKVAAAKTHIASIEHAAFEERVILADNAARSGDHALAAALYAELYKQAPARTELLFKAALAAQQAQKWADAAGYFEAYLKAAPGDGPLIGDAKARLQSVRQRLAPGAATAPPQPAAKEPVSPQSTQPANGSAAQASSPPALPAPQVAGSAALQPPQATATHGAAWPKPRLKPQGRPEARQCRGASRWLQWL